MPQQPYSNGIHSESDKALPRHLPEPSHKMAGAERTYFCCIANANLFGIMFRNPLQDGFQPSGIRRFRRNLLFSMQNEQSQKTQQSALDDQFIAWKFGAVGIFGFPSRQFAACEDNTDHPASDVCSVPDARFAAEEYTFRHTDLLHHPEVPDQK